MKVSYSWLKEFVDLKVSPQSLSEQLTMAGLSVAALESVAGDWVYDIEVTSNRPDWLSVRGIVREVAAITGAKIKKTSQTVKRLPQAKKKKTPALFSVRIDDKSGCKAYYGNLIKNVHVGPSPEGLKKRLEILGFRSINNVVDITNYCLLEFGQPLHAFDFDRINNGAIVVRRAHEGETLALIDGSSKKLDKTVLVIADDKQPLAAAGVMGGADSEVSANTKNILLESACFDPVVVRRSSRSLGVASDSSYRFERGVDRAGVKAALDHATQMICDLCGGELEAAGFQGDTKMPALRKITFDLSDAREILSLDITPSKAKDILSRLGFGVTLRKKDIFEITVPGFRRDVAIKEDITEEIARTYGYDKIPLTAPQIKPFSLATPLPQLLEERFKKLLTGMGLKEVITYSLAGSQDYQRSSLSVPEEARVLENFLSQDYQILRTTLLPQLLQCAAFNINHNNPGFEIFESSRVFAKGKERLSLGVLLCGLKRNSWIKESMPYTFFDLKGILELLLQEAKIKDLSWQPADISFAVQGKGCTLFVGNKPVATLAEVNSAVKRSWGIKTKEDIFVAELLIEELIPYADLKKRFLPLASTPSITRDISLLTGASVSYAKIKEAIARSAKGYLKNISLADCYQGKEVPAGSLGLTISVEYGAQDKTLTEAEVNPVHQAVLDVLKDQLSLTLR